MCAPEVHTLRPVGAHAPPRTPTRVVAVFVVSFSRSIVFILLWNSHCLTDRAQCILDYQVMHLEVCKTIFGAYNAVALEVKVLLLSFEKLLKISDM
jgi:hypothetical protein